MSALIPSDSTYMTLAHKSFRRVRLLTSALTCSQYTTYAWGMDELQPISRRGKNSFAGMGATIVDSLSTLWIMGMKAEFANGTDWVRTELSYPLTQVCTSPVCASQQLADKYIVLVRREHACRACL